MLRRILLAGLLLLTAGCTRYTPTQLDQTAQALGCWPDGYEQPPPTRTPLPSPTSTGTPTVPVTPTATPVPTYLPCTPLPLTPTRTPRPTPTPTPWTRPTPQPGGSHTTPPLNLSNQPGRDVDPQVAVAPGSAWAAVIWTNLHPDRDDRSTVFVKVQRPGSRGWSPGQGLNTTTVTGNGGMPAVTIDPAGRAWAVWSQQRDGRAEAPTLSWSDDQGRTWSAPAVLPLPGDVTGAQMYRLAVDAGGTLHILYAAASCFDCSRFVHVAGHPDRGWRLDDQIAPGAKQLYGALTTLQMPGGALRTVAAVGCYAGCPTGPLLVTQDGAGPWTQRMVPNVDARIADQAVVGLSLTPFTRDGQPAVCVAWGQYSRSGVFSSCSWDAGTTWQPTEIIAYHDPPRPPTPAPGATPVPAESDLADRAFAPTLLYDAASDQLMAVWLLRQERDGSGATPMYLVWSYRPARPAGAWQPVIDGDVQEPALRLLAPTRRAQARTPSAAYSGAGEALAVWSEREQDESMDIYVGRFTPTGMLIGGN